jgi:dTMP kinase
MSKPDAGRLGKSKGFFIAFEGVDGSGNTTQSKLLCKYLESKGQKVMMTKEPTDNPIGKTIRDVLQHRLKTSPLALQLLFVSDRAHHIFEEVGPALNLGKTVITDRYMFSTMAFGALDVEMEFLMQLNSRFLVPDITFIIDVPAEVAIGRVEMRLKASKSKDGPELFEKVEKSRKIRENYRKVAVMYPNVHIIDGNRPIDSVAKDVRKVVDGLIG